MAYFLPFNIVPNITEAEIGTHVSFFNISFSQKVNLGWTLRNDFGLNSNGKQIENRGKVLNLNQRLDLRRMCIVLPADFLRNYP